MPLTPFDKLQALGVGFLAGAAAFDPALPSLVMVHGAGSRGEMWLNQIGPLKVHANTLALDLPGHGATPGPAASTIAGYAGWLRETIEEAFDGPLVVMGHSMGGAVAQQAVLDGCAVCGLVLVGTGARLKVAPDFLDGFRQDFRRTVAAIMDWAHAPGAPAELVREGERYMLACPPEVVGGDFEACSRFDVREALSVIQVPSLIVCGTEDRLTPPKLSHELAGSLTDSRLCLISGAGHMVMLEERAAFNQVVAEFIQAISRADR